MASAAIREVSGFTGESEAQTALFAALAALDIATLTYAHPAIFTVEEGLALDLPAHIPGQHGKSLFLVTPTGDLWLVVACEDTRVDLKTLAQNLGVKRFSFAKPETMIEVLGVAPGSATPFALLHDTQRRVRVVVEDRFRAAKQCVFHPLDNRYSTVISVEDLYRFLQSLKLELHTLPLAKKDA